MDRITKIAEALGRLAAEGPPRSASDLMTYLRHEGLVFQTAVDGKVCACGGRDGVILSVGGADPTPVGRILLIAFDHSEPRRTGAAALEVEQAKELVNRLVDAIATAERVLAEPIGEGASGG